MAGTIVAIILFILITSIVSYGLSIVSVGETIIFTIFKKKSNDENLLLRNEDDDESEEVDVDNNLEESSD